MSQPSNEHPLLILTKDRSQIFDYYARKACKILKFTQEWTAEEVLDEISKFDLKSYPNLFIFIIGHDNFELSVANGGEKKMKVDSKAFQKVLRKFKCNRSIYLKITSKNESEPKFYCRYEDTEEFYEMDSIDFVDELDAQILDYLVEQDNISNSSQTAIDEIYKKVFENHLKTKNLIKNYKILNNFVSEQVECEVMNDKIAEDVAGPSGYKPKNFKTVNRFQFESKNNKEVHLVQNNSKEIIEDLKNHKFVLMSNDLASNHGWILDYITNKLRELNPGMWTSHVDLRKLYELVGVENNEIDFENLTIERILAQKSKFESEIFKKLYKSGKVCILLGEFDDLDPNFVEFVTKLCRTFKQNDGNELWIAVKDFFEVNPTENLELEIIFKLNNLNLVRLEIAEHKSSIFHKTLRNSIENHFNISEVLDMINSNNSQSNDLIFIDFNSKEMLIKELTVERVPKSLNDSNLSKSFVNMNDNSESILHILVKRCEFEDLKFIWQKLEELFSSPEEFKKFLDHRTTANNENFLHIAGKCDSIEVHQVLWDLLMKTFVDRQELLDFILQKSKSNDNFIHYVILKGNSSITKFTLIKIQEVFNYKQTNSIITSKGQFDRNFLQLAAIGTKDNKVFQNFWKLLKKFLDSYDQFLQFVLDVDKIGQNIFHLASSTDVLKLIMFELSKITSHENISRKLCDIDSDGCNLFQIAAMLNKPLQFQQNLWEIVQNHFNENEFWMMLKNIDNYGNNVLCKAIELNSKEVVEFIWTQIKAFMMRNDAWFEYSNFNQISEKNWTQIAMESNLGVLELCEEMETEYGLIVAERKIEHEFNIMEILDFNFTTSLPEIHRPLIDIPASAPVDTQDKQSSDLSYPNCKILRFSHDEISSKKSNLKPQIYQNLFLINVQDKNFEFFDLSFEAKWRSRDISALQLSLLNFYCNSSMFMKLTSIDENESKYFFKGDDDCEFAEVDVVEFVDKIDGENLKVLAEHEEILMNLETTIENKFLKILYQPRSFSKRWTIDGSAEDIDMISLDDEIFNFKELTDGEVLKDIKNNKFILISGSGKSWTLKNMKIKLNERSPSMLTAYMDLKQYEEQFKAQDTALDFSAFMIEKILKLSTKFQAKIFKKLYKNGKVCILFDEFDKIAPDCAEFVIKLFQSFQQNGGNQLWIATNEESAEDLMIILKIKNSYKLNEFEACRRVDMDAACRKLLQIEVARSESLEYHQNLWNVAYNFFNVSELFGLVNHTADDEDNLILKVISNHSKEVVELTFLELNRILNNGSEIGFLRYLQHVNKHSETIFHLIVKQKDSRSLKMFYETAKAFLNPQQLATLFSQQTTSKHENVLQLATKCDDFKFHKIIWNILLNTFENRDDLTELIMQPSRFNDNFAHYLVVHDKPDIIDFTFTKLKETFTPTQYQAILKSKGEHGRNLLQAAVVSCRNIKTHQILWKSLKETCNSAAEFTEYLQIVDNNSNNIFHLAACFTTKEVLEFMILELAAIADINKILLTSGLAGKNLLQSAARQNHSLDLHKILWELIKKYVGTSDLWGMIKHTDDLGDNVLSDVIECNTFDVAVFTWLQIKKFLSKMSTEYRDLNIERFTGRDLIELSLQNRTDSNVHEFCKKMMVEYESLFKMPEILIHDGYNSKVQPVDFIIMPKSPPTEYNFRSLRQQHRNNEWKQHPGKNRSNI